MEDHTFLVGQEFSDVKIFRNAIKEAAIAQHFELRTIKSDLARYVAKCATEGCPWRIRAVKLPNAPTFTIRSVEGQHTCGKNTQNGHHQASVDWIVSFIEERLRNDSSYKPKDILHDIRKKYGITIPYKQAWRAKERGLAAIYGSSEEGYCLLPSYCDQMRETNPRSIIELYTTGTDDRFHRLFVSFYASIYGFLNGCLPIVCLGGIQLKSKYLGTLISATSFDADGGLFPLAFGVVDAENDATWMWFLSELHRALEVDSLNMPQILFMSNAQKEITDAVKMKFPDASHMLCVRHLSDSIRGVFKNSRVVSLLCKAACATTVIGFKEKMTELEESSYEAAKWIQQFPPPCWALVYSDRSRYGHLSSNIEEFNKWILEARELPVIQVIERIQSKLVAEFEDRRSKSNTWFSILVPSAEKRMMEAISTSSTHDVLRSNEVEFEILSADRSNIVNIRTCSCSCRDWQLHGIPCSHAVAALDSCQKDVYAFAEKCFTVASYREAYARSITVVPAKYEWRQTSKEEPVQEEIQVVRPPKLQRLPGRPENKRTRVEEAGRDKHTVHCSNCNQTGHYKTTCKA